MRGIREASNGGRVRVRIIHGLNISHKELIYLLQKSTSYQSKVLRACSDGLVGKDHGSSPTATHKEDNQEASNGGRVRVRIIHGLNISHKELIYLLQKSTSYQSKVLRACSDGLVGKDHGSSPTATHKEDNQ